MQAGPKFIYLHKRVSGMGLGGFHNLWSHIETTTAATVCKEFP